MLPLFSKEQLDELAKVEELLTPCNELAAAQPQEVGDLVQVVNDLVDKIQQLSVGQQLLVPGGWVGLQTANAVMHIVEKTAANTFAFVTCNSAAGLVYHPSVPTSDAKLKSKCSIRLDGIPVDRMSSPVVWTLLLSQWMKNPPSVRPLARPGFLLASAFL